MGTDIHVYLERKVNNGPWTPDKGHSYEKQYNDLYSRKETLRELECFGRDYDLFYRMAGVRGFAGKVKHFTERGLPNDVSDDVSFTIKTSGYHSSSYLSIEELKTCITKYPIQKELSDPFNGGWTSNPTNLFDYIEKERFDDLLLGTKTEFRIVFAFDS